MSTFRVVQIEGKKALVKDGFKDLREARKWVVEEYQRRPVGYYKRPLVVEEVPRAEAAAPEFKHTLTPFQIASRAKLLNEFKQSNPGPVDAKLQNAIKDEREAGLMYEQLAAELQYSGLGVHSGEVKMIALDETRHRKSLEKILESVRQRR